MTDELRPNIDPHPLSEYVAWAGRSNREPILEVFKEKFPTTGEVLEIASGSGLHVNYFAPHFPQVLFQPSDLKEEVFESIKQKKVEQGNANVVDPIKIDLTAPETWLSIKDRRYDVIFVINIFQVAPVSIADGLFALAAETLKDDGFISIYGPFKVGGQYTTESNEAFDKEILAASVPEWGLKDVKDLEASALQHGFILKQQIDRPINNFILVFSKK